MNQTLSLTTLGELEPAAGSTSSRALRAGEPLGGHLVQGHVDGTGEVRSRRAEDGFARRSARRGPRGARRYVAEHGSVAVDGVSLTVAGARRRTGFEVVADPGDARAHHARRARRGRARVNLEVDVVARYAERLMQGFQTKKERDG